MAVNEAVLCAINGGSSLSRSTDFGDRLSRSIEAQKKRTGSNNSGEALLLQYLMRLAMNATNVTRSIHVDYGGGKVR